MRLATSTNIMDFVFDRKDSCVSVVECLERCTKAGFRVFDMNFPDQGLPGRLLTHDSWEKEIIELKNYCDTMGLEFSQSHLEFYDVCDPAIPDRQWREQLVQRGIKASSMLGVKWAVLHTGSVYENASYSYKKSKIANMEYLRPHLELAEKLGLGLAVENVPDRDYRRFSGSIEELIDLVDSLDAPNLGICWDFGHANLAKLDQPYWLRQIGGRLKAVHVADNNGLSDEHIAPFYGTIKWLPIMEALRDIGFEQDFTYEIHNMTKRLPNNLRETQLQHLFEIGNYLIQMAQ